jgi:hypothetical protein
MLSIPVTPSSSIDMLDLTHATIEGNGVFDVLMRAVKAHIDQEWASNRIKGNEYSTVYLGALQTTLQLAIQFVITKDKTNAEVELLKLSQSKELASIALIGQQKANLLLESLNIPKQGLLLDKQVLESNAKVSMITQQTSNLTAESLNIPKQGLLIDVQKDKTAQDLLIGIAQTSLLTQQRLNTISEELVISANKTKIDAEKLFINQKTLTERAQVDASVIGANSLSDRQAAVHAAQAAGYTRNAEQEAAKIMSNGFNIRTTVADDPGDLINNHFSDADIGAVIIKLKAGIGIPP